jgi:hypothetical protein
LEQLLMYQKYSTVINELCVLMYSFTIKHKERET